MSFEYTKTRREYTKGKEDNGGGLMQQRVYDDKHWLELWKMMEKIYGAIRQSGCAGANPAWRIASEESEAGEKI